MKPVFVKIIIFAGIVLKEIGKYAEKDDTIFGEYVKAPTI